MIDLLLKFPDRQTAIDYGVAYGITAPDTEESISFKAPDLNIHVIGEHAYIVEDGDDATLIEVAGWWAMLRVVEVAGNDPSIPNDIASFVVEPDPLNPAIPNRVWA